MVSVGDRAVAWSLTERERWPLGVPPASRIAEYFAPAVRDVDGRRVKLGLTAGNYCAAGACFAIAQVVGTTDLEAAGVPHAYRVSGLELEQDAKRRGAWADAPRPGDLAIFDRGKVGDWTRHVGRVVSVGATSYRSIEANGTGGGWVLTERPLGQAALRGFVRYPAAVAAATDPAELLVGVGLGWLAGKGFGLW